MIKKIFEGVPLSEAEELLSNYVEENEIFPNEELLEEDKDHQLWQDINYIHVPDLGVNIHDCTYFNGDLNEETKEIEYMADFTGWLFRDEDTDEIVYEEGYSSFGAAVWNGFARECEALTCDIYVNID